MFETLENYSLVTAILPRQSTTNVLDEVLSSGAAHAMSMSARGTLMQDKWYQSLLPTLSPEQEMLFFLVPEHDLIHLMEQIVMVGKLRHYGAGSIFASRCESLVCAKDFPIWRPGKYEFESVSFDIVFKEDLIAVFHITDRDEAEAISKAAIKAGAQGPTTTYIRGYGLRDRLGLLRITKQHEKEMVTVVTDKYGVDAVTQAMAEVGRVDQPGRGLIYQVPIYQGLANLASVFQPKKHSASIQQIIRAIDEMQGNGDWRANQLLIHDPKAEEFEGNSRGLTRGLEMLHVIARRKDTEILLQTILAAGARGASVSNWRISENEGDQTDTGKRLNHELGCISLLLNPANTDDIRARVQEEIIEREMKETAFFTTEVPLARTFSKLR